MLLEMVSLREKGNAGWYYWNSTFCQLKDASPSYILTSCTIPLLLTRHLPLWMLTLFMGNILDESYCFFATVFMSFLHYTFINFVHFLISLLVIQLIYSSVTVKLHNYMNIHSLIQQHRFCECEILPVLLKTFIFKCVHHVEALVVPLAANFFPKSPDVTTIPNIVNVFSFIVL